MLLAVLPVLGIGLALSWQSVVMEREHAGEYQATVTAQVAENLAHILNSQEHQLRVLALSHDLAALSPEARTRELRILLLADAGASSGSRAFETITFLNQDGIEAGRVALREPTRSYEGSDWSKAPAFVVPRDRHETYFGPVHFDELTGAPVMTLALPVFSPQSRRLVGVLAADLSVLSVTSALARAKVGREGVAYIVDGSGRVLAHPDRSIVFKETVFRAPTSASTMTRGIDGSYALIASERIQFGNDALTLVTEQPLTEASEHLVRYLVLIGVVVFVALGAAVALGWLLNRQLVRPIEGLAATAQQIAGGDNQTRATVPRDDELGDLARAFNLMTERLVATISDLEEQRNFGQTVIESLAYPFYVVRAEDGELRLANRAATSEQVPSVSRCEWVEAEPGADVGSAAHPRTLAAVRRLRRPVVMEVIDGQTKTAYEVYGFPMLDEIGEVAYLIEYRIDVSERKALTAQLYQAQKLESIGSLAGGIAHDFNNLMTVVLASSDVTREELDAGEPPLERFEEIHAAGVRAAALTRQLLAFSRRQVMAMALLDVNELIRHLAKLLGRVIGEHIDFRLDLEEQPCRVRADAGQLEQVITNLVVNARDALPKGGRIMVATAVIDVGDHEASLPDDVTAGRYVAIRVSDNGQGMSAEVKEKIFEPFFTTKEVGRGTGLGLAVLYGIVKQHKGHVIVDSVPGCGSTFSVYLPAEMGDANAVERAPSFARLPRGTETILLAEDEAGIRKMVTKTLSSLGYSVCAQPSGDDALRFVREATTAIDLLLTDVVMPGMSGIELARTLRAERPELAVLYMSGYTEDAFEYEGQFEAAAVLLQKPMTREELALRVRAVLDERARPS